MVQVDPGKEGIYRGQCAALCGRDMASCPSSWMCDSDDFKKWVDEQKAALKQAGTRAPHRALRASIVELVT